MVRCADAGGDTMWSSLERAYEELSQPLQELCEGLSALHDAEPHGRPERRTIHPVVRVHPETGRKALYVNEHFTRRLVELSAAESDLLLGHLTRWVQQPRFTVRYRWTTGTIALWDNRCTQHVVLNDVEGERMALLLIPFGLLSLGAAVVEADWFFDRMWVRVLDRVVGRTATRVLYVLGGASSLLTGLTIGLAPTAF